MSSTPQHPVALITVSRKRKYMYYNRDILALLDYVTRAHEIEIRPSSVVRCPSVSKLSLYLMHGFLSNFSCCFPWVIHWDVF